jgi:hypothetical protein
VARLTGRLLGIDRLHSIIHRFAGWSADDAA